MPMEVKSAPKIDTQSPKLILSTLECNETESIASIEIECEPTNEDSLDKIMSWFSQKEILPGNPEEIPHTYESKQKEKVCSETFSRSVKLNQIVLPNNKSKGMKNPPKLALFSSMRC